MQLSSTSTSRLSSYVDELCSRYPDRHVGGPGNLAATRFAAETFRSFGWSVESSRFDCIDWVNGGGRLRVCHLDLPVHVGPYSLACDAAGRLTTASTIEELEAGDYRGTILLLHGDLVREPLMPKGFIFWNPEGHRRIIRALEGCGALAVVAATGHNPDLAGGAYPFPLLEDADFDVPNAYMRDVDGELALRYAGSHAQLRLDSRRIEASGYNVVARRGPADGERVVVFGHIDSKPGSPGALDNAGGTIVLLALAKLLADYEGPRAVELVPLNGEDNYANPGEMLYLRQNEGRMGDIKLGVNVDGAGWRGHRAEISTYGATPELEATIAASLGRHPALGRGPEWMQGDHGLFLYAGRPALAITTADFAELCATVTHTTGDAPELVEVETLAAVAAFIADVIRSL